MMVTAALVGIDPPALIVAGRSRNLQSYRGYMTSFPPPRIISLLSDQLDGAGPRDTGLSHAIALAVGEGGLPETLRLHPTSEVVAFGRQDTLSPGYGAAVRAARQAGCVPVERLAGGFHRGSLAFSWAIPTAEPRAGIHARFAALADLMAAAFRSLGLDARVGEVSGEYCPGAYSVNLGGRLKVMGVGQRLVRGAAHLGGVVVVRDAARLRRILIPVYRALELEWHPETAGAISDALPDIELDTVRRAILDELSAHATLEPATAPISVLERASVLASAHTPGP
jgi:lipoate-protein ligase A